MRLFVTPWPQTVPHGGAKPVNQAALLATRGHPVLGTRLAWAFAASQGARIRAGIIESVSPVGLPGFRDLGLGIFGGAALARVLEMGRTISQSESSMLLLGEYGTGKKLVARAFHRMSGRPGPCVVLDAASLAEQESDTELARQLAFAESGTLVLDDLGALPLVGQARLLAAIEQGQSPLLMRSASGQVVVAGVLTKGASSCCGRDRYVRLDAIRAWFDEAAPEPAMPDAPCGGIAEDGRCLYGSALWCSGNSLVAEACARGTRCGWDGDAHGFRRVAPALDPCAGVDSIGGCREGVALWCDHGKLVRTGCDCGEVCRIDGRTGAPHCADPSD